MASTDDAPPLILASGSDTRRRMLEDAGVAFIVMPADVDEHAIRARLFNANPSILHAHIAEALARAKAEHVSAANPHAIVIGSDQILSYGGKILDKPHDLEDAKRSLLELRGGEHNLHSSVALARGGKTEWTATDSATLKMRAFSDEALDTYLRSVGTTILSSVGAYQIEGPGIQLFERVTGSHFAILGMPLLPLLAELRSRRMLVT